MFATSQVVNMRGMFAAAGAFEGGNLTSWDVSRVTDMSSIFLMTFFDGDVSTWDTSSVEDLSNGKFASKGDSVAHDLFLRTIAYFHTTSVL